MFNPMNEPKPSTLLNWWERELISPVETLGFILRSQISFDPELFEDEDEWLQEYIYSLSEGVETIDDSMIEMLEILESMRETAKDMRETLRSMGDSLRTIIDMLIKEEQRLQKKRKSQNGEQDSYFE